MSELPQSLQTMAQKFVTLDSGSIEFFIRETFVKRNMSIPQIAELCGTYPNKIRRSIKQLGLPLPTKSEAQKLALASGRHPHPTKGKKRTHETKLAISEAMGTVWDNLTNAERLHRSKIGKEQWDAMSDEDKAALRQKAYEGVRQAAKRGSKLERFLNGELLSRGYDVQAHAEQKLLNEKLHIDLFLPTLRVAIEVDGPSHFSPIWGEKVLKRNQKADAQKNGLLLGAGYCVIRVQQHKNLSAKYKRELLNALLTTLEEIKTTFPEKSKRYIVLGEI